MTPRALLSLLFHGDKATDVVETALSIGVFDELEGGPVRLGELAFRLDVLPMRLYKLLDCLECCGFVTRRQDTDVLLDTEYHAVAGVRDAAAEVVGPGSRERDRNRYPWPALHGRLRKVLTGEVSMPPELFSWPPATDEQLATFEHSMATGVGPAIEAFQAHHFWAGDRPYRLLDVGGGDGTLAANLLLDTPSLTVDVYNLPGVKPLVDETRSRFGLGARLGFVGGDFRTESFPDGYDALSFVRVLHDWPPEVAAELLGKAHAALRPGGRVFVCEEFRTPERLAAQFFWSYFLMGVDSCGSMLRAADHYVRVLAGLGFAEIEVLPGPFEIVAGTRR